MSSVIPRGFCARYHPVKPLLEGCFLPGTGVCHGKAEPAKRELGKPPAMSVPGALLCSGWHKWHRLSVPQVAQGWHVHSHQSLAPPLALRVLIN